MIQINLLPPEYRPRTGTPVTRFVAIVVGVVLIASATGAWFYTHFIELSNVRELRDVRAEEATTKEQQKKYSEALQTEIDVYERRRDAIQTINRSRTLWSRKLDQFFDILAESSGQQAHAVWLDSIDVPPQRLSAARKMAAKKGEQNGGMFRFSGYLAMDTSVDAPALSSQLFRSLTGDPDATGVRTDFYDDFISINNPNISVVTSSARAEEQLSPPVVGSFRYELVLKAPDGPGARGQKTK